MKYLTISQLAKKAEVNIETLRYYERQGLIPEPIRTSAGYRQYSLDYVDRIHFIKRAKELGFTLREIDDLLTLRIDDETTCDEVRERAEAKIMEIEKKI
ncbi:MAG: MerR family transcriptional regulator, partial [bacterium]